MNKETIFPRTNSTTTVLFNAGNHNPSPLANFPFAIFKDLFSSGLDVTTAWDNKGDIVIGNDIWIGYERL